MYTMRSEVFLVLNTKNTILYILSFFLSFTSSPAPPFFRLLHHINLPASFSSALSYVPTFQPPISNLLYFRFYSPTVLLLPTPPCASSPVLFLLRTIKLPFLWLLFFVFPCLNHPSYFHFLPLTLHPHKSILYLHYLVFLSVFLYCFIFLPTSHLTVK